MVYAEFGAQTECIMGKWKIENGHTAYFGIIVFQNNNNCHPM